MNARLIVAVAAALVVSVASGQTTSTGSGQAYPSKPIRILPGQPGGGGDLQMRIISPTMSSRLGQPVIVENRPGNLIGGIVARAQPDGYTLLVAGSTVLFGPLLDKTDYDTLKDFSAISSVGITPNILVVHPSLPVNSVKELIALAKSKPGVLNYSSGATGSSYHIAGELFKSTAGVDIVRVSYVGAGPTITAVLSGEVQMSFGTSTSVASFIKAGKLKALAHTGLKPTPLAPNLPTMADSGLSGFEFTSPVNVLFAPVKTPVSIIRRLNQEFVAVLALPEVKEKFLSLGADAVSSTPEGIAAQVKLEFAAVAKLVKNAGITAK